ncbi:MAG: electron transfer flavoprotein subunit beta/FixA family protein [Syntrophorhabdaceae bacterium]|nr:electron transfer flavoprotein subunit beta/FixA family protein [Syntrophorhabdaceae bacterium]
MKILVFIKQVADTEARILIKGDNKSLEIENKYNLNFFDEFAVEEAIRLKTKLKDSKITVCTYGGKKAIEALRTAIAMGADQAFLIDNTDLDTEDPLITARILSEFAKKEGFDIILCGRQAIDDENGAIGAMVAEFLNIPHVSAILKLDVKDDKHMIVESDAEGGKGTIEVELPALFTTQKGINEPRVPLITGVMKAMKANIPVIDPTTLGLKKEELIKDTSKIEVLFYETPKARPPVKIIDGETPQEKAKKLVKLLKEEAKVL